MYILLSVITRDVFICIQAYIVFVFYFLIYLITFLSVAYFYMMCGIFLRVDFKALLRGWVDDWCGERTSY